MELYKILKANNDDEAILDKSKEKFLKYKKILDEIEENTNNSTKVLNLLPIMEDLYKAIDEENIQYLKAIYFKERCQGYINYINNNQTQNKDLDFKENEKLDAYVEIYKMLDSLTAESDNVSLILNIIESNEKYDKIFSSNSHYTSTHIEENVSNKTSSEDEENSDEYTNFFNKINDKEVEDNSKVRNQIANTKRKYQKVSTEDKSEEKEKLTEKVKRYTVKIIDRMIAQEEVEKKIKHHKEMMKNRPPKNTYSGKKSDRVRAKQAFINKVKKEIKRKQDFLDACRGKKKVEEKLEEISPEKVEVQINTENNTINIVENENKVQDIPTYKNFVLFDKNDIFTRLNESEDYKRYREEDDSKVKEKFGASASYIGKNDYNPETVPRVLGEPIYDFIYMKKDQEKIFSGYNSLNEHIEVYRLGKFGFRTLFKENGKPGYKDEMLSHIKVIKRSLKGKPREFDVLADIINSKLEDDEYINIFTNYYLSDYMLENAEKNNAKYLGELECFNGEFDIVYEEHRVSAAIENEFISNIYLNTIKRGEK